MTSLDWRMAEATNQTTFRDMNEWTREDDDRREGGWESGTYLCECGDGTCTSPILLTATEYEAVRSEPARFAIALDHENPELHSVLTEYAGYATVDESFGPTARLARSLDPRR